MAKKSLIDPKEFKDVFGLTFSALAREHGFTKQYFMYLLAGRRRSRCYEFEELVYELRYMLERIHKAEIATADYKYRKGLKIIEKMEDLTRRTEA